MRFRRATLTLIALWCACSPAVRAQQQDTADIPPPHLARVDRTATLDREDVADTATAGVPLVFGDRVRTERGRVEVLFPDGSALDLDEYSTIEFEGPTLLRMTSGRVILFAAGAGNPASAVQFQIDTPVASAQTDGPGEYRVSFTGTPSNPQVEIRNSQSAIRCSRRSRARSACSVSDWELTETYSPAAIDMAPATRPATPASRISLLTAAAAATPRIKLAVEMMPSLAPSTAARSQPIRSTRWVSL